MKEIEKEETQKKELKKYGYFLKKNSQTKKNNEFLYNNKKGYKIMEGDFLEAVIQNKVIVSNGIVPVIAITNDDYYNYSNEVILIPSGTKIIGVATVRNNTVVVTFKRIILPNLFSFNLPSLSLEETGSLGLKGKIERHYMEKYGNSLLMGIIEGAVNIATANNNKNVFAGSAQNSLSILEETSKEILQERRNIQNTITLKNGSKCLVYFTQDFLISEY